MRTLLALPLVATLGLAGCSSSASVEEGALEEEVSAQLEETVGVAPDEVDCPETLRAESARPCGAPSRPGPTRSD